MENSLLEKLEEAQRELGVYERRGLDTSSFKIFLKNFRQFLRLINEETPYTQELPFEDKLDIIKSFLEDRRAFPRINDVIKFANEKLGIEFKNQKESRKTTISRIIGRIRSKPELKEDLKLAVISVRNEMMHRSSSIKSRKDIVNAQTFSRWAEIIKNI